MWNWLCYGGKGIVHRRQNFGLAVHQSPIHIKEDQRQVIQALQLLKRVIGHIIHVPLKRFPCALHMGR